MALVAIGSLPTSVAAECDGPVPSFHDALATAKRVVIGDVVAVRRGGMVRPTASDPSSSHFLLRIRYTPVGTAPTFMLIRDLPTQPCAGFVLAREGDRIAMAFGAIDYSPPIEVNTVAWIRGTPWDHAGVETTTTAEVFRRLDMTPPDTATLNPGSAPGLSLGLIVVLTAGAVGGLLFWRRARRLM